MMQIQDLEMMQVLTVNQASINPIRGGMSFLLIDPVSSMENTDIINFDSQYMLLNDGFSSFSVFSRITTTPDSSTSVIRTSMVTSIG